MTKTLADFKREINIGDSILFTEKIEHNTPAAINDKQKVLRFVSYKDTTGFYLKGIHDTNKRGSFCNWPKANALEYTGNNFTITETDQANKVWQVRKYQIIRDDNQC